MLREGFDVHHMDGDRANNEPSNLVLVEHTDHMRAHDMKIRLGRLRPKPPKPQQQTPRVRPKRPTRAAVRRAHAAYEAAKRALDAEMQALAKRPS